MRVTVEPASATCTASKKLREFKDCCSWFSERLASHRPDYELAPRCFASNPARGTRVRGRIAKLSAISSPSTLFCAPAQLFPLDITAPGTQVRAAQSVNGRACVLLELSPLRAHSQHMADDPTKLASDRQRIDVSQDYECRYWAQRFDVTPDRLKQVVRKVGPMVGDVARELGKG